MRVTVAVGQLVGLLIGDTLTVSGVEAVTAFALTRFSQGSDSLVTSVRFWHALRLFLCLGEVQDESETLVTSGTLFFTFIVVFSFCGNSLAAFLETALRSILPSTGSG